MASVTPSLPVHLRGRGRDGEPFPVQVVRLEGAAQEAHAVPLQLRPDARSNHRNARFRQEQRLELARRHGVAADQQGLAAAQFEEDGEERLVGTGHGSWLLCAAGAPNGCGREIREDRAGASSGA